MTRTTITLPDHLAVALRRAARRRGTSVSSVVRDALALHLGLSDEPRSLPFRALGRSGQRTTGRDFEDVLADEGFGESQR